MTDVQPALLVAADAADAAARAAALVEGYVRGSPAPVLGLATGSTMIGVYDALVARHRDAGLSFAACTAYLLDEYVGLGADHPQRYAHVITEMFAGRVDLDAGAVHAPRVDAVDLNCACAAYDHDVRHAAVGVQLLGIGRNGHLAFNEPGASFDSRTRVVELSATTRADNARFFDGPATAPTRAITQGLATILAAHHLVLVALGAHKAEALRAALRGPIHTATPASVLRRHPRVTVIADPPAAALLGC